MSPRRRQPDYILGGSITEAPNGYRVIKQYNPMYPTPMSVQQVYSAASERRYAPKWDGKEPDAARDIYLTDPFPITCGQCGAHFGPFVAYNARAEYGILRHTTHEYVRQGQFPPEQVRRTPRQRFESNRVAFRIDGEIGGKAAKAFAKFECHRCGHPYEYNLRKLGKDLFESRPNRHALMP